MEYLIVFLEGIASFISPCLLPMLPMYISYFAGQEVGKRKTIINVLSFILGFTITFVLLGIFAGTFGHLMKQYSTYINIIMGLIVILFGLNYLGIIHIFDKTKGIKKTNKNLGILSSIIFGTIFALCWTPCVGAFLGTALMLAASTGSVLKGALMLLLFSLGLGIPFLLSALFLEKLQRTFAFIKNNYDTINKICGVILIILGTLIMVGFNFQGFTINQEKEEIYSNTQNNNITNNEQTFENVIQNEQVTNNVTNNQEQNTVETPLQNVVRNNIANGETTVTTEYKPIKINESQFEEVVLNSEVPVLVEFYATWCQPCKYMTPILNQIASEVKDKAKIVKIDVDENEELSYKYNAMSIPTMYIFKDGKITKMFIGVREKEELYNALVN